MDNKESAKSGAQFGGTWSWMSSPLVARPKGKKAEGIVPEFQTCPLGAGAVFFDETRRPDANTQTAQHW